MRYVIAREEHRCNQCSKQIKKDEVCVQSGRRFYHRECYAKLRLLLPKKFYEPNMSETARRKLILDGFLKDLAKQS